MATRISGSFESREDLEHAVEDLKASGVASNRLSVLLPHSTGEVTGDSTTPGEAAVAGASTGVLVGGALTWLAALGTVAIPGVGPFLAAGPIASLLAGAGAGGLVGALIGLGFSDRDADEYESLTREGQGLLIVDCDTPRDEDAARTAIQRYGGQNVLPIAGPREAARSSVSPQSKTSRQGSSKSGEGLASGVEISRQLIEHRAFQIWELEGRPSGHESEHWARAEQELKHQYR